MINGGWLNRPAPNFLSPKNPANMETQALEHLWAISPDTVFGALVAVLLLFNIIQYRRNRKLEDNLIALNRDANGALSTIVNTIQMMKNDQDEMRHTLLDKILSK